MGKKIRRLIALLMAAALLLTTALATDILEWNSEGSGTAPRNYIIIIDNSLSTSRRTIATGEPTDPTGLRFSAASALYDKMDLQNTNVGLIVFGEPDKCKVYGPVARNAEDADEQIRSHMNEQDNLPGAKLTDINGALDTAHEMAKGFAEGDTNIVLITDGVNDLTNTSTALTDEDNLKANDATVETARAIAADGNKTYIVALTAEGASSFRDTFMAFINRVAEAAGGQDNGQGGFDNVFEATDSGLNDAINRILNRTTDVSDNSEEATLANRQAERLFTIPYSGITEASVEINFNADNRNDLDRISLFDPSGEQHLLWARGEGGKSSGAFAVSEANNYVNLTIYEPQKGDWRVLVEGADGVKITTYVHMSHNVRLSVQPEDAAIIANHDVSFRVWFQKFENGAYVDIADPALYADSTARMTFQPADGSISPYTVQLETQSDRYIYRGSFNRPGEWVASVSVSNAYLEKSIDQIHFNVDVDVTPTPMPVGVVDEIVVGISPEAQAPENVHDLRFFDKNASEVTVSWNARGDVESTSASLYRGDSASPELVENVRSSLTFTADQLGADPWRLVISAMPKNGTADDAVTLEQRFQRYPDPSTLTGLSLTVNGEPGDGGEYAVDEGKARLSWSVEGDVDSYQLTVTDPSGNALLDETYASDTTSAACTLKDAGTHTAVLKAVPLYGEPEDAQQVELKMAPHFMTAVEKLIANLPLILGGVAALAALIAVALVLREKKRPRMTGKLRVVYNGRFETIVFDPKMKATKMYRDTQLSTHPVIAGWKSTEPQLYAVLADLYMTMTKTDPDGMIPGDLTATRHKVFDAEAYRIDDRRQTATWYVVRGENGVTVPVSLPDGHTEKVTFQYVDY